MLLLTLHRCKGRGPRRAVVHAQPARRGGRRRPTACQQPCGRSAQYGDLLLSLDVPLTEAKAAAASSPRTGSTTPAGSATTLPSPAPSPLYDISAQTCATAL